LAYVLSLALVLLAATVFTLLRSEKLFVSIEALIGIAFAMATTGAVILIDKGAGGDVHLKEMLVGSILWVKWSAILKSLAVYLVIGALHYRFRDKVLLVTEDYEKAKAGGLRVKLWDFFFYLTLGIVVTHAVKIGGILVVFAFLIIPASISMLFFAEGTRSKDGKVGPFKKGGFRTAQIVGWPILPVVVHGSRQILPKGDLAFRPGTIEVEVLDPVPAEEVQNRPWEEIMEEVRQRMVEHFEKV